MNYKYFPITLFTLIFILLSSPIFSQRKIDYTFVEVSKSDMKWWNNLDEQWQLVFNRKVGFGTEVTQAKLDQLFSATEIAITGKNITHLKPIERFKNLEVFYCAGNLVSDLSPLAKLTQLKKLVADRNQIKSIKPLKKLQHLEYLSIAQNQISSLSHLAKNQKLTHDENAIMHVPLIYLRM